MGAVTIRTVAEDAGVSIATVSRVLAGTGGVTPALRRSVEESARKLGYARNSVASALRRSKTLTIGMVVPEIANPFNIELVQEVEDALYARGFQMLLCSAHQDQERERKALDSLISQQVDGLIISPMDSLASMDAVKNAAAARPLVQVDQRIDGLTADWIGVDDEQGIGLVLRHLKEQGVSSAGFIGGRGVDSSAVTRYEAFLRICEDLDIAVAESHVRLGDYSTSFGREAMAELRQAALPDALVCGADVIAIGALQTCHREGLKVPESLLLTGFDDIEFADMCTPSLTTVRQPLKAIARQAVKVLLDGGRETTGRLALAPELVVRESTVRASATAEVHHD